MHYDYLLVGAGLFNATIAHQAIQAGKKCLVIDKRNHIGGNIYTQEMAGIHVHKYGAHIFHTDDKKVWDFVNSFAQFNRYTNCPVANYKGTMYNLPFNMNTFTRIWPDIVTPEQARSRIHIQATEMAGKIPTNLEEQAISLVGRDIYERLIKGYTEKQWGRKCTELPASIITRLPVRLIFDNNYFNDPFQGIPVGGYTQIIQKMFVPELLTQEAFNAWWDKVPEKIRESLAQFRNMAGRQEIFQVKGYTIIKDCYNAGPESMAAALNVLGNKSGRRIAVLGDMLELGVRTQAEHYKIGRIAAEKADIVLAYGPNSVRVLYGARTGGMGESKARAFTERNRLVSVLKQMAKPGDVILFKGSRGMRMELVLERFLQKDE